MARQTGREVAHSDVSTEEHVQVLVGVGLDAPTAGFVAALDAGTAAGELDEGGTGISALTGRPTRTLADHVQRVLAQV